MAGGLFNNGSGPSIVDCEALLDSRAANLIGGLLQMGVLVALGTSRDRGALSVTITNDGAYDREYVRDLDSLVDYLGRATAALRSMGVGTGEPEPARPHRATRSRQKLT